MNDEKSQAKKFIYFGHCRQSRKIPGKIIENVAVLYYS